MSIALKAEADEHGKGMPDLVNEHIGLNSFSSCAKKHTFLSQLVSSLQSQRSFVLKNNLH